jgi:hypothetical protein
MKISSQLVTVRANFQQARLALGRTCKGPPRSKDQCLEERYEALGGAFEGSSTKAMVRTFRLLSQRFQKAFRKMILGEPPRPQLKEDDPRSSTAQLGLPGSPLDKVV